MTAAQRERPGAGGTASRPDRQSQQSPKYPVQGETTSAGVVALPRKRITDRRRAAWRLSELRRLAAFRRQHGLRLAPETWAFMIAATLASAPAGPYAAGRGGRFVEWHGLDVISLRSVISDIDLGAFSDDELGTIIRDVTRWQTENGSRLVRADRAAQMLAITAEERIFCRIRTMGAVDETKAERRERAKADKAERERERMRAKRAGHVRPRALKQNSTEAAEPWVAAGVSRATWFRRKKSGNIPSLTGETADVAILNKIKGLATDPVSRSATAPWPVRPHVVKALNIRFAQILRNMMRDDEDAA